MSIELKMPALSPTMEKGTIAKWLVREGDIVNPGDLIAEVETDKATMEVEAVDQGRVARLLVPEGAGDVAVGTVIALLGDASEPAAPPLEEDAPTVAGPTEEAPIRSAPSPISSDGELETSRTRRSSPADRIKVSPLAQRIATAKGIDLSALSGTGPNGRIVRADLGIEPLGAQREAARVAASANTTRPNTVMPPPDVPLEAVKLSSMRKTIARRLSESKQTVPHFYLTGRCCLEPLLKFRSELNEFLVNKGIKISVNDFLIKALAMALVEVPDANVQYGGEILYRFHRADISMAVAVEGGLLTPVIKNADSMSLSGIAEMSKELAHRARAGKLLPSEYLGGTASISNLGMFGIEGMFPVINPPQALIMGIGSGTAQPWNRNGEIVLATVVGVTGSFDHRAIDGAVAAQFMEAFRRLVETPLALAS